MAFKDDDLNMWNQWKSDPNSKNLSALIKQVKPILYTGTQAYRGSLSDAVIDAEAKKQAVTAFKTYDPSRGVKVSTHVMNYMPKVNRLNYKYQDLYKVPELRRIKFDTFNRATNDLNESLGREPTTEEVASSLGWSKAEVARHQAESFGELSDSQPYAADVGAYDLETENIAAYVYHDLTPRDKLVLEHTTGYNGKQVLNRQQIMKQLNMTSGQLSYAKQRISQKILEAKGRGIT